MINAIIGHTNDKNYTDKWTKGIAGAPPPRYAKILARDMKKWQNFWQKWKMAKFVNFFACAQNFLGLNFLEKIQNFLNSWDT